jgi:hypothetical protein
VKRRLLVAAISGRLSRLEVDCALRSDTLKPIGPKLLRFDQTEARNARTWNKRLRQAALAEVLRIIQQEEASRPSARLSAEEVLPSLGAL